jgi:alpha-D-xyloside xylohydrolase
VIYGLTMNLWPAADGCVCRSRKGPFLFILLFLVTPLVATAQVTETLKDGVAVSVGDRRLEIRVCREDIIRVLFASPGGFFARSSLSVVADACPGPAFETRTRKGVVSVSTKRLTAQVVLATGAVSFLDPAGRLLLAEKKVGGKTISVAEVMGESTFHVRAEFEPSEGEGFYGLGAHQNGLMNYAGRDVDLYQLNTVDVVPFLTSSRGYGVLWDNTSQTRFGDLKTPVHVPKARLYDAQGGPGGLTGTYRQGDCQTGAVVGTRVDPQIAFGAPEDRPAVSALHSAPQVSHSEIHPKLVRGPVCVTWEGHIESEGAGDYDVMTYANDGLRVWIDGKLVIENWRQGWLAWWDEVRVRWGARERHQVRIEWRREEGEGTLRLKWKTPPRTPYTSLWSEVGDGIDYYFVYGPDLDDVVAGYRELTGRAPLVPRWALGLFQSRDLYRTAQDSLDALIEFRKRRIPIDTIVQDWQYWRPGQWGSHEFDPERFPDPTGWIREIHDRLKARLMISVWPKFYPETANFRAMQEKGFLYPETLKRPTRDWLNNVHTFYDAFNPEARKLFWKQMNEALFSKGVDAWWMDATEPEMINEGTPESLKATMNPTALGSGARMANAYALVNSQAVYEGQRSVDPDKRVFILTRSAFAGMQRYASASWSGDVSADWDSLRKQIPAGLNMAISGIPWWTSDVGGYTVPVRWSGPNPKAEDVEEWRELVTRWFQFATFCPLLRVHGKPPYREMWNFGGDEGHRAYTTQLAFDRLRYRMLPYTYSVAASVTHRHASVMRPLIMDFREEPAVRNIADQFLFGPSLLVNPVHTPRTTRRSVYLPRGGWYDFWTGVRLEGGRRIEAPAPFESMPLYVRAGSILPMGPELQYTDEKPADPVTLWVYSGADAAFDLYDDDGVTYGYERGASATIPMRFDEAKGELTIGERIGSYPGMPATREFRVVFVSGSAAVPHSETPAGARSIRYDGRAVVVSSRPSSASNSLDTR